MRAWPAESHGDTVTLPGKAHFEVTDHTVNTSFSDYEPSLAIFFYTK